VVALRLRQFGYRETKTVAVESLKGAQQSQWQRKVGMRLGTTCQQRNPRAGIRYGETKAETMTNASNAQHGMCFGQELIYSLILMSWFSLP
jgi:hypothetical protein